MAKMSLNRHAFGLASAIVVVIVELSGYLWHGMMGQPSMMNFMYPGFWGNPAMMLIALAASVVFAYAAGYAFAWLYNEYNKK